jgi:tRNA threonylcarbamoyl adenosine modification protein YjeE
LGAGKTVFAKGFIHELCGDDVTVTSPTYVLQNIYPTKSTIIHHLDLYRCTEGDMFRLDLAQISQDISLIEWWDRIPQLDRYFSRILKISIQYGDPKGDFECRTITLESKDDTFNKIF